MLNVNSSNAFWIQVIFFAYCAVLNYLKNAKVGGHVGHFSESGHQVNIFM